jgi:hypothetical protein
MTIEPKSFIAWMTTLFKRPGQSAAEFMQEIKALTPEDRQWYQRELEAAGYPVLNAVH